jgi:hypothetical protein
MINPDELAICKRRGHNPFYLADNKWSQCQFCGLWLRQVRVDEEREDAPPEDEIHPLAMLLRKTKGQEK